MFGIAETIKTICFPLKIFNINTDEIKLLVCISLSVIPILKKELFEIKEVFIAKNLVRYLTGQNDADIGLFMDGSAHKVHAD